MVDEFYRLALANGGTDAGPPVPPPEIRRQLLTTHSCAILTANKIEAVTFTSK